MSSYKGGLHSEKLDILILPFTKPDKTLPRTNLHLMNSYVMGGYTRCKMSTGACTEEFDSLTFFKVEGGIVYSVSWFQRLWPTDLLQ